MKASEMTNDELAKELIETVGLDGPFCICERCSTVREAAARLRQAADTQEQCDKAVESMHTQLMHLANEGKTAVDIGRLSKYFAHLENILRGDAGNDNENK